MKFSCLIANYNNGEYLEEAIGSVLNQSLQDFEIIIVDDGSTDNSSEVYKRYDKNDRIKILYNNSNRGCGYTKNRCLQEASGEFLGFLDPDDILLPTAMEDMVAALENTTYVAAYSSFAWYSEYFSGQYNIHYKKRKSDKMHLDQSYLSVFFVFRNKNINIDPKLKRAVDQDLYLKVEELGSILHLPKLHYIYRATNKSISLNNNLHKATFWESKVHESACLRRGIEPEVHFATWFNRKLNLYSTDSSSELRRSKEYRLGYLLFHPFQVVTRILSRMFK